MDAFWDASFSSSSSIPSFSSSSTSVGVSDLAHVVPSPRAAPSFTYTPSFGNSWRRSYSSSPRFFSGYAVQSHHFLDSCFLCKKAITQKDDIFMYRGDAPFCSEECRQQQIDTDEALESDRMVSTSKASLQKPSCSMKRKPSLIISAAKCGNDRSRAGTALVGLKLML